MWADVSCLCGLVKQQVSLASESFPVQATFCHCRICRSSSGVLCTCYLPLSTPPSSLEHLTSFRASQDECRFFCSSCGAHIFQHISSVDNYLVASGLIQHDSDTVQVTLHQSVAETADGGLAIWSPVRTLEPSERSPKPNPHPLVGIPKDDKSELQRPAEREQRLYARCQCGGVEYFVTPPTEKSTRPSSPWPDLLVPYHSSSPENADDIKWWMRADDTKYLAGLCSCASCRLATGFPIQAWAFVPRINLVKTDGTEMDFALESLQQYESSPGIYREFCRSCGATAFWHCLERPELIDVSIGLLHAKSGSRAEQWLEWETGRVSFAEDALDQQLVRVLERELGKWKNPDCVQCPNAYFLRDFCIGSEVPLTPPVRERQEIQNTLVQFQISSDESTPKERERGQILHSMTFEEEKRSRGFSL